MDKTLSEADILNEMVSFDAGAILPEGARGLLALQFTPRAIARMNELAEKNRLDALSAPEKEEMDKYMRVGNFLSVVKAKARLSLLKQAPTS